VSSRIHSLTTRHGGQKRLKLWALRADREAMSMKKALDGDGRKGDWIEAVG